MYYSVNVLLGSLSLASDRNSALLNRKAESFAHVTTKAKQGLIQGSGDVIRTQVFSVRFLALLPLWWFTAQAGSAFYGRWPPTLQFMSSATPKEGKHLFPSCCSQRPRISSKWFSLAWLRSHVPPWTNTVWPGGHDALSGCAGVSYFLWAEDENSHRKSHVPWLQWS